MISITSLLAEVEVYTQRRSQITSSKLILYSEFLCFCLIVVIFKRVKFFLSKSPVNCQIFFKIQDTKPADFKILLSSSILLSFHTLRSI